MSLETEAAAEAGAAKTGAASSTESRSRNSVQQETQQPRVSVSGGSVSDSPQTTSLSRSHSAAASQPAALGSPANASGTAASVPSSASAEPRSAAHGSSETAHGFDNEWIELQKLQDMQEDAEFGSLLPHSESGSATSAPGGSAAAGDADQRSVYVGNVDYSCTPADLHEHFKVCGQINRITIMVDKYTGHPKGYAYIEFNSEAAAQNALLLTDSSLKERQLKVVSKRKNIPGFSRGRGGAGAPSWRGARGALHRGRGRGALGSYRPIYRGRGGLARGYGRPYYAE